MSGARCDPGAQQTTADPVQVLRTLGMLAILQLALPVNLAVTAVALARSALVSAPRAVATEPKTVLVSGGKMTKALQLARSFHAAGHRVVLVESTKYRLTGHRFSRAVDRFHTVPDPQDPEYAEALLRIVRAEGVDVYVPVSSPAASHADARAKAALSAYCEVVHADPDLVARLDDKEAFTALADSLGLPTPQSHRVTTPEQVAEFDFAGAGRDFILKSIPYDPVHRLDLTPLPRPTQAETGDFALSKPISAQSPWVLQELLTGQEYCTHSTVRNGRVQVWCCCPSSPWQMNYEMVDKPAIRAWVTDFVGALRLTGQVSFDFIETADGSIHPIECNPRTHSAITLFHDHPDLTAAYLDDDQPVITPLTGSRATYWIYHEVWRLLTEPGRVHRMRTIVAGKDAVFDASDPLPFLLLHHLHIPWLLLRSLWHGTPWVRIDLAIGKLVEPAGD